MINIIVLTSTESGANSLSDINTNFATLGTQANLIGTPVYDEVPAGAINGINMTYTIANTPITGTVRVYVDGARFNPSSFSVSGTTLTVNVAPQTQIVIDYNK